MRKLSCKSAAWLALGGIISFSTLAAKTDPAIGDIGPTAEAYIASHPDKVGEAVATYLADHPEFLIAASETLHQRQQVAQKQAYVQLALQYRSELLSDSSPSVGPADAKAAVVMFLTTSVPGAARCRPWWKRW